MESDALMELSTSVSKRTLTLCQMLLLTAVVCGLEFCSSAAFCYRPPMLLGAGMNEESMSAILGIGPLICLFLVPIIGRASDRCKSQYGRRRPFIFLLCLLLILGLIMAPYGEVLGIWMFGQHEYSKSVGIASMTAGLVLLDFSSQACFTSCEAFLSDASRGTPQHERCFTVYSSMVSIGGCIGYIITSLEWSNNSIGVFFGSQEKSAFSILILLFTVSMVASLCIAQQPPNAKDPQLMITIPGSSIKHKQELPLCPQHIQKSISMDHNNVICKVPESKTGSSDMPQIGADEGLFILDPNQPSPQRKFQSNQKICTPSCSLCKCIVSIIVYFVPNALKALFQIPYVLNRLALTNFFGWMAILVFNFFYTEFVGEVIYGGDPNAEIGSEARMLFDEGVRMGSWGLLAHCIVSALYALLIESLVARFGTKWTYFFGMFVFTLVMTVMMFSRNIYVVTLMAALTGIPYGTITTIPFILVTLYHEHQETFFYDTRTADRRVPPRGVGTDLATLDSAFFLSQVLLSASMGYVVHLTGTALAYIICAGGMGALACFCATRLISSKIQMQHHIKNKFVRPSAIEM